MRRLPIYFLVDVSESMVGDPIEQVQNGMRTITQELRVDPYALETAFISVIVFAGKAKTLVPLTELYKFYPPTFPIGGGTSLGEGLNYLMNDLDNSVQKTTSESKGDWKPIIFLFTDGTPTDDPSGAFKRWNSNYRKHCNLVAISIGDNVDTRMLGEITDNVLLLKDTTASSFSQFFKWVTASIKATSVSVSDYSSDELKLAPISGTGVEKADTSLKCKIDENFVVLRAKCQTTGKAYLIKYAKRLHPFKLAGADMFNVMDFKLVGAYTIDEGSYVQLSAGKEQRNNINTSQLVGAPCCPCCGNQLGLVICECGNIFCVGEEVTSKCPWCGQYVQLVSGDENGINIKRTLG